MGKKMLKEVYKKVPKIDQFPKTFESVLQWEHVKGAQGKVTGVHSMPVPVAVTMRIVSKILNPTAKHHITLRDPGLLQSARKITYLVYDQLYKDVWDNELNLYLMSFVPGLLSNTVQCESALWAFLTRWNATPPKDAIKSLMGSFKQKGLSDTQIKEVMEADEWQKLMEVSSSIPYGTLATISMSKEIADKYTYAAGRFGIMMPDVSVKQLASDQEAPVHFLMSDSEAQFRLIMSKESCNAESGIEMDFVSLDRETFAEHAKDHSSFSLKDSEHFAEIIPHEETETEKNYLQQMERCEKLSAAVLDLIQTKIDENEKL